MLYEGAQHDLDVLRREVTSLEQLLRESKERTADAEHRNSDLY